MDVDDSTVNTMTTESSTINTMTAGVSTAVPVTETSSNTSPVKEEPSTSVNLVEVADGIAPATQLPVDVAPTTTTMTMPSEGASVTGYLRGRAQALMNTMVRHRRDEVPPKQWSPDDLDELGALLNLMAEVVMTPEIGHKSKLEVIIGLAVKQDRCTLPEPYLTIAGQLQNRWKAINEGAAATPITSTSAPATTRAVQPSLAHGVRWGQAPTSDDRVVRIPPTNHPIFGNQGPMHHIRTVIGGQRISYKIDPDYPRPNANVFGHNGLAVGTCWPLRVAALRDGAHGASMAGIAGKLDEGAYSVVVSSEYGGLNRDEGDSILYSGSNSHDNRDPENIDLSGQTKVLTASIASGHPVRVLRGSNTGWSGAPTMGFRYDGLYRVVSHTQRRNNVGGAYRSFRLERMPGQPPIARNRPTAAERLVFARVQNGY